jgi:hypothetical protein
MSGPLGAGYKFECRQAPSAPRVGAGSGPKARRKQGPREAALGECDRVSVYWRRCASPVKYGLIPGEKEGSLETAGSGPTPGSWQIIPKLKMDVIFVLLVCAYRGAGRGEKT